MVTTALRHKYHDSAKLGSEETGTAQTQQER
jgi:hypothetical protein